MPEPGYFLNPNWWAMTVPTRGNEIARAVWSGLRMLAPNTASLLSGEPAPPLPNLPATPGKVPSTDDPRIAGAVGEAANSGINFLPMPGAGIASAGRGILGLMRRATPELVESLASRSPFMNNPPVKSLHPFTADYPSGALADAAGRLDADVEGRPLVAGRIVGRSALGGADEALAPAEFDPVAKAITGDSVVGVAPREIEKNAGRFLVQFGPDGRPVYRILVDKNLPATTKDKVAAHEIGHAVEHTAGRTEGIPQSGLKTELRGVYNDLNNPDLAARRRVDPTVDPRNNSILRNYGPEQLGCRGAQVDRELMAEAIRAYMADPNYLKTVAPKTAAAIRAAVNANPRLSRIIQFNTIGGLAAMNGIDAGSLPIPKEQPPILSQ